MNSRLVFSTLLCLSMCVTSLAQGSEEKYEDSAKLRRLATKICAFYSGSGAKIAQDSKAEIKKHIIKYEGKSNPSGKQMLLFLNKSKHEMTCRKGGVEINYMMVAFDRSAEQSLFDELLFGELTPDDQSVLPDVNAVSYTGKNRTPQTVLDYIDEIIRTNRLGTATNKEIIDLRKTFVDELGAKHFHELPAKEQALFNKTTP